MAQWGKTDDAANSVSWAASSISAGSGKANIAANNTALFANTTSGAFITGQIIGQFGISGDEATATGQIPGWTLRREGTGGRAGRVTYETLVAGNFITSDSDNGTIPNYKLSFTTQPSNASANVTASETAVFTVVAISKPAGATIAYQWQANTGSGFANISNGAVYSGVDTTELTVDDVNGLNNASYRVIISTTNAANVTSSSAKLTVTS